MGIRIVPEQQPSDLTADQYVTAAQKQWGKSRARLTDILREVSSLGSLLYGQETVKWHHIRGALHTAKKLREECDRLIDALTEIVETGERVKEHRR